MREDLDAWGNPRRLNPNFNTETGGRDFSKFMQWHREARGDVDPKVQARMKRLQSNINSFKKPVEEKKEIEIIVQKPKFFIKEYQNHFEFKNLQHRRGLYNLEMPKERFRIHASHLSCTQDEWLKLLYQRKKTTYQERMLLDLELITDLFTSLNEHKSQKKAKLSVEAMLELDFAMENKFVTGTRLEYMPFQEDKVIHNVGVSNGGEYHRSANIAGNRTQLKYIKDRNILYSLTGTASRTVLQGVYHGLLGKSPYLATKDSGANFETQVLLQLTKSHMTINCMTPHARGQTKTVTLTKVK
jgi:hypothetical protein